MANRLHSMASSVDPEKRVIVNLAVGPQQVDLSDPVREAFARGLVAKDDGSLIGEFRTVPDLLGFLYPHVPRRAFLKGDHLRHSGSVREVAREVLLEALKMVEEGSWSPQGGLWVWEANPAALSSILSQGLPFDPEGSSLQPACAMPSPSGGPSGPAIYPWWFPRDG